MRILRHFVGGFAAQNIHDVTGAKADAGSLLHPVNAAEHLARRVGGVPHRRRVQAVVAIHAGLAVFAKVAQQAHAPAVRVFGQRQQCVKLAAHDLFELFAGDFAGVYHAALVHHVLQAVDHPGVGRQAVAAGTAGLLVIAFDVFGHVQVRHKAHIGLVDAHAKSDGGHHDHAVVAQKAVLPLLAHRGVQARVVGHGLEAGVLQHVGNFFDPPA